MTNSNFPRIFSRPALFTSAASALLLSACAHFQGISGSEQVKTPADYASTQSLPSQGGAWPDQNWVAGIGGAPLQDLVTEALHANPGLHVAAARIAAASAMSEAAGAAARPTVGASFSDTYQRFTEYGLIPPPFAGGYFSDGELAVGFSYDLDFWGKHAAELRAAVSDEKAAQAEQYAARLALSTAVVHAWLQLARQYEQLDLIEQQLAIRGKIDRLTQLRLAAGLDTQSDKQQTALQDASLRAEQAQWQESIALTRNQLAALLGQGPDRGQSIARPSLPSKPTDSMLPNELPLALLGRRPDIVAARWRVEAAQGEIADAKAQFYPNVNLSAFIGASSLGLDNLFKSGSRVAGVSPAISVPIFEGGRLRAQLKGKTAAYDGAVALYNQALTDALHDVADQVQSLRAAQIRIDQRHAATQAAENTLVLAQQREHAGTASMLQVLAAQSAWLSQRQQEIDVQARSVELHLALIKALGGGFDAAPDGLSNPPAVNPGSHSTANEPLNGTPSPSSSIANSAP